MILTLERHAYMKDRTMGTMYFSDQQVHTLERPWIPSLHHMGGENFKSCVPDGEYILKPFSSQKHPNCWILSNDYLNVYETQQSSPGRWAILIHSGNYVRDVVGCIAPGLTADESHVWNSRVAMDLLRDTIPEGDHTLIIKPAGAVN